MGTWGVSAFENDAAMDFAADLSGNAQMNALSRVARNTEMFFE